MASQQQRTERVVIRLEPLISEALDKAVRASGGSQSSYVRSLILMDLKSRGLLTEELIMELVC